MSGLETIAAIAAVGGTALTAGGTILTGMQAQANAGAEQTALEYRAADEKAAAAKAAGERRKKAEYAKSRAIAVAANSGGGATDPTVLDTLGDITQESEYQAGLETFLGKRRADNLIAKGNNVAAAGDTAFTSSLLTGAGQTLTSLGANADTILSGTSSYFTKFGGSGPPPLSLTPDDYYYG